MNLRNLVGGEYAGAGHQRATGGSGHPGYGKDLSMYGLEDHPRIGHVRSDAGAGA